MRFIHTGDCHLGGWRIPSLAELTLSSFTNLVDTAIKERVDFVVIAGDFFDAAYPPIEAIKVAFEQLRRLKEAFIPVFIIAGSHDYSASGKSFLDVLEKAGFVKNLYDTEERATNIYLKPTIFKNIALYGYPGKRSAREVEDIERIKIHDAPGLFKILVLHTALRDAVGNLPIPAVDQEKLPKVDYTALAHLHVNYNKNNRVYSGPLFPNNSSELEELGGGSFYIVDTSGKIERREIKLKEVQIIDLEIKNAYTAGDKAKDIIKNLNVKDKIIILRLNGFLETGTTADINFSEVESLTTKLGAFAMLKNTSKLFASDKEIFLPQSAEEVEEELIAAFNKDKSNIFSPIVPNLLSALQTDKKEEERAATFEDRLFEEFAKAAGI